jgi:hypothetical protein
MTVRISQSDSYVAIDPRFIDVCEPGSIAVCGCVPAVPVLVGATVVCDRLRIRLGPHDQLDPVELVIRLTGIRRGFAGHRFPDRTREQFIANEAYLRSHYPGAGQ